MFDYLKTFFNTKEKLKSKSLDEILLLLEQHRYFVNREEVYNEIFSRIDKIGSGVLLYTYFKKINDKEVKEKLYNTLVLNINDSYSSEKLLELKDAIKNEPKEERHIFQNLQSKCDYKVTSEDIKNIIERKLRHLKKSQQLSTKKTIIDYKYIERLIESTDENEKIKEAIKELLKIKKQALGIIHSRYEKNNFLYKEEAEASLNYEFLSEKSFFELDMPLTFIQKHYSIYQDLSQTDKGWKYISKHTPEMLDITDEEYENSTPKSLYLMEKRTDAKLALEYLDQLNQQKNYTFEQEFERCQYDQFFSINNLSNITYLTYEYKVLYKFLESLPANYRLLFEAYFSDSKEALKKNFLHVLRIPQLACLYIVLNESDVENILIDFFLEHIDEYFPNNSNNDTYSSHTSHIDILHRCWKTLHLKAFKRKDELLAKIETMLLTYIEASLEFTRLFYIIKKEQNKEPLANSTKQPSQYLLSSIF